MATIAFATLISVSSVIGLWTAFRDPPTPPALETAVPSVARIPALTSRFTIGEPGLMSSIAYGEGSAWVSVADDAPGSTGRIVRIDPSNGVAITRIRVPVVPRWETGGGGLSVADGAVWVAGSDSRGTSTSVLRIDVSTNEVTRLFAIEDEVAADVVQHDGIVWLLVRGDESTPTVYRIDASTGRTEASIPLDGRYGRSIMTVGESIFASVATSSGENGGAVDGTRLLRIDPETNAVEGRHQLPAIAAISAGDGGLWAATGRDLLRLDPSTGMVDSVIEHVNTGDAISVGDDSVWFFGPAGEPRGLARLDVATSEVLATRGEEGGDGIAVAAGPQSAWLVDYAGLVTRIQMVPDCPPVAPGGYGPVLSPTSGPPGTKVTISGRVPMYDENGGYSPPEGIVQAWWNFGGVGQDWTDLLPGGIEPSPARPGRVMVVSEVRMPDACSYSATFLVPEAADGSYPLTLLSLDGRGGTSLTSHARGVEFRVRN